MSWVRIRCLILGAIILVGAARLLAYLAYSLFGLTARFETYHLEAKMVLLAYRMQAGLGLYPAWQDHPHVSNFYGPIYFGLVGLVGRTLDVAVPGLFLIGRAITFLSALGTTILIGLELNRKYDRGAAVAGALLSLGAAPMLGFSVMVRPDLLGEFFGFAGFLVSGRPPRRSLLGGSALLLLAVLTKQTAGLFLLAATAALFFEGERRRAIELLVVSLTALALVLVLGSCVAGPNFVPSLLGDAATPWASFSWIQTSTRLALMSPDLLVIPILGLFIWGWGRPRDVRSFTLGVILLAASLGTIAKRGADLNYCMSLRIVEAQAVGTLWHLVESARTRRRRACATLAAALAVVVCLPSVGGMADYAWSSYKVASLLEGPLGRTFDKTHAQIRREAEDPRARVLTDSSMIELYQKERAAFGDPYLFRLQVDTGQIRPTRMQHWIKAEVYDLIVTKHDLFSPTYASFEFGLPMPLVEEARSHYVPIGTAADFYLYRPRRAMPTASP